MKATPAFDIAFAPSRALAAGLILVHAATIVPLVAAALPHWITATVLCGLALHGLWAVRRLALLRSPRSMAAIALERGGNCVLTARDGTRRGGFVDPSTVVLGSLVILAVRETPGGRLHRSLILGDMLDADGFRRLRIALKWGGTQVPVGDAA